jgi:hypothetical protein
MIRFDVPPLHSGDTCSVLPTPPPCLNYVGELAAAQPDNTALWGIFLIGIVAGFALAFVLTAPAAFKLGKDEGWQAALEGRNPRYRRNFQHAQKR